MAVGPQEIERRLRDIHAREFNAVRGFSGNRVNAQQVAGRRQLRSPPSPSLRRLRLPIPFHVARPVLLALLRLHLVRLFVITDDAFQGTDCDCRTFRAADDQCDWA